MKTFLSRTLIASLVVASASAVAAVAPSGSALAPEGASAAVLNTAIHGGPSGTTTSRRASFHLLGTGGAVRIQCKLNRGAWYLCARTNSKSIVLRNLSRRTHTFYARAVNRSGRVDSTPAKRTWRVR